MREKYTSTILNFLKLLSEDSSEILLHFAVEFVFCVSFFVFSVSSFAKTQRFLEEQTTRIAYAFRILRAKNP